MGAYFGVKVGSDRTKDAIKGQKEEAAKAQAFALATHPDDAQQALGALAQMAGADAPGPPAPK